MGLTKREIELLYISTTNMYLKEGIDNQKAEEFFNLSMKLFDIKDSPGCITVLVENPGTVEVSR